MDQIGDNGDMKRVMEIYEMQKKSVKDLTSLNLVKQKDELVLKEDIEEHEALQKYKTQLIHKYPDGKIPQKELNEFNKKRKHDKFNEFLKDKLFSIVFRDVEFM